MSALHPAPLLRLSLQHCHHGEVPSVPSNEDRRRAFLATRPNCAPVELNNFKPWPHLAAKGESCPQS